LPLSQRRLWHRPRLSLRWNAPEPLGHHEEEFRKLKKTAISRLVRLAIAANRLCLAERRYFQGFDDIACGTACAAEKIVEITGFFAYRQYPHGTNERRIGGGDLISAVKSLRDDNDALPRSVRMEAPRITVNFHSISRYFAFPRFNFQFFTIQLVGFQMIGDWTIKNIRGAR